MTADLATSPPVAPVGDRPKRARSARLTSTARKAMILEAAMRFFAENGFSGTIREFAAYMDVSTALIFRYFNTKEDLIRAVYETLYVQRVNSDWLRILQDRDTSIESRLKAFYRSYASVADDYRWIRVALGASLSNLPLIKDYLDSYMSSILERIALEISFAQTGVDRPKATRDEIEMVWHLHSSLIYFLIRKHLHHSTTAGNSIDQMDKAIAHFLRGFTPSLAD